MIGTAMALLGSAAISSGGSFLGGLFGGNAAKKAAQQQAAAADAAAKKVQDATDAVNPRIENAANEAIGWNNDAANFASSTYSDATKAATAGVKDAAGRAIGRVDAATADANKLLDPYAKAGVDATGKLSDLASEKFTFSQDDPSYQWRLQQGEEALARSNAARGISTNGGAVRAVTRLGQNMASQEYGAAFDRFQRGQSGRLAILSDLAGRGVTASTTQGTNLTHAAEYGGDVDLTASKYAGDVGNASAKYTGDVGINAAQFGGSMHTAAVNETSHNTINAARTSADLIAAKGNAQAAGTVGSANAWTNAFAGMANAAGSYAQGLQLKDLLAGLSSSGFQLDKTMATHA